MRKKSMEFLLLLIMVCVFIAFNYNSFDGWVTKQISPEITIQVSRVIDGDTVVDTDGVHYRLLGINTPEKGEYLYNEAKKFLEEKTLNKTIGIEKHGKDRYSRELVYLFNTNSKKSINLEIVKNGYANYYFPEGKDENYDDFVNAWEECIEDNINLCESSDNVCASADCIELAQFEYGKDVILYNKCDFDCNITKWTIKDEGRKKFIFTKNFILKSSESVRITNEDFKEEYVWTKTGDTLFLRDDKGRLVLSERY